ncbi:hypothetical protein LNQ49_06465 [Flavobacterium sp. F-65]|jgi:hypothetical protein|uniref:XRE family transcriptional regulator n=1 Tax=Flavobacterium pisciphilum TaxID=2893755 RepID=A0ABS8MR53_9FLAO|nr:hypothetical protein [Flavobacterium sp. F-65]MCC9071236.1 hypothetical protein [Flavobacterium sp. F-65]
MELTKVAKEKLGTDEVKMQIALELGKSYLTMRRWINKNHDNLTKTKSIEAITKFTGLKENEIFE